MKNYLVLGFLFMFGCNSQSSFKDFELIPGPKGNTGAAGANGANGSSTSVVSAQASAEQCANGGTVNTHFVDSNSNHALDEEETVITTSVICNGLDGAKGDRGEKGEDGRDGNHGEKGEKGDRGENGAPGLNGVAGPRGENGRDGAQGSQGERGEKGDRGDNGAQGIQGIQGLQGLRGEKGDAAPAVGADDTFDESGTSKTTICHRTASGAMKTLRVTSKARTAHLNNHSSDYTGECSGSALDY